MSSPNRRALQTIEEVQFLLQQPAFATAGRTAADGEWVFDCTRPRRSLSRPAAANARQAQQLVLEQVRKER